MPTLGLGTWKAAENLVGQAVEFAISKAGYKHIDCAAIYGNEKEIGVAFEKVIGKTIKREDLFITSKLWNTNHKSENVEKALRQTLSDLKLDYLDLYLMHWGIAFKPGTEIFEPVPISETWKAMENLVKKGLVKSIGVSNFTSIMIHDLLSYAAIKPAVNQIELHPYNTQEELIAYCKNQDITVTAYSPLGRSGIRRDGKKGSKIADEQVVKAIAVKYKKTPSQVLINWAVGRGTIPIPKSITPARIAENFEVFDFELTNLEQKEISNLNKNYRFVNPGDWWDIPYFS